MFCLPLGRSQLPFENYYQYYVGVIIIIWLILYTYFYFVNSLLTDIQNVDNITITIIKVKIVSRLLRKTCDIFTKTDNSVASFDRGKIL